MSAVTIDASHFKAAIFDMDGTMVNNMAYHKKAWQAFLLQHGFELDDDAFGRLFGKKNDVLLRTLFNRELSDAEIATYADEKEALYRELYAPDIVEIAGLSALVDNLHRSGFKLAIATTAPEKNRDFVLRALGLEGKFDAIVGDEHVTHGKPDPEIYLATAEALGVAPKDCIAFEDSLPGVTSAKNAGMTVVGILSSHTADEIGDADYALPDFTTLYLGSN